MDTPEPVPGSVSSAPLPPMGAPTVAPHKNHKKVFFIIGLALIVILSIVSYSSGYFTSPEKLLAESAESYKNVTSVTTNIKLTLDASSIKDIPDPSQFLPGASKIITIDLSGKASNPTDKIARKVEGTFSIASGTQEIKIEERVIDDTLYVKLVKAPSLPFIPIDQFKDKWISAPFMADGMVLNASSPSKFDLTQEERDHLADILKRSHLIDVTEKHLPENMSDALSLHFEFALNHEGIQKYIQEVYSYLHSKISDIPSLDNLTDADFAKFWSAIKDFHGEMWIGVRDHLPRKILMSFNATNPEEPDAGALKVSMELTYKDWNKPFNVEVPAGAVSYKELMGGLMGMGGGMEEMPEPDLGDASVFSQKSTDPFTNARAKGTEAAIKSTLSNMRAQAELFYDMNGNAYKGFCTAKGQNGAYELAVQFPQNTNYKCNDASNSWAAGAQIIEGYWCVDSTGSSAVTSSLPKGTSCN